MSLKAIACFVFIFSSYMMSWGFLLVFVLFELTKANLYCNKELKYWIVKWVKVQYSTLYLLYFTEPIKSFWYYEAYRAIETSSCGSPLHYSCGFKVTIALLYVSLKMSSVKVIPVCEIPRQHAVLSPCCLLSSKAPFSPVQNKQWHATSTTLKPKLKAKMSQARYIFIYITKTET